MLYSEPGVFMAKKTRKPMKKEDESKPLSIHSLILDAKYGMSEKLSQYFDAGWELLSPPVHIGTGFDRFDGCINSALFLVLLRRKSEERKK